MINQNKNTPSTVGQRIRVAREKAQLTQADLARKLEYGSPTAISLIEAGDRSVKVEKLKEIAEILHADVGYLATGTPSSATFRTALRADDSFTPGDVKEIESYIDFILERKGKDGRGADKK